MEEKINTKSLLKSLSKDTLIYGIGGVLAKSISFLALPLLTRIFSPYEYGQIEIVAIMSTFFGTFIALGMDASQSFYFFKYKSYDIKKQSKLVSSIIQFRIIFGVIVILVSTFISPFLNNIFFDGSLSKELFLIAFTGSLFQQILHQSADVLRLIFRPIPYIFIVLIQTILSNLLIIYSILILKSGIYGYFLAITLASFLAALISFFYIKRYINFSKIHYDQWPKLLNFGLPIFAAGLADYFMNTSDRWFIQYFHDSSDVGIFGIAAKFTILLTFTVSTFRKAWWPLALKSMNEKGGKNLIKKVSRYYLLITSILVILFCYLSPFILKIFTGPEFHSGWLIMSILAWQALFNGFDSIISIGIWKANKSFLEFPLTLFALIVGIFTNFIFVPKYASIGASVATAITYLLWNVITLLISERNWKVGYEKIIFLKILFLSILIEIALIFSYQVLYEPLRFIIVLIFLVFLSNLALLKKEKIILINNIKNFALRKS